MQWLRDEGYVVCRSEGYNAFSRTRWDLFGFVDLVAIKPGEILGVQATSDANVSARKHKCEALEAYRIWLESGARFEIHGWGKHGPAGTRKVWKLRRVVAPWQQQQSDASSVDSSLDTDSECSSQPTSATEGSSAGAK